MFELTGSIQEGRVAGVFVSSAGTRIPVTIANASQLRRPFTMLAQVLGVLALLGCWIPFAIQSERAIPQFLGALLFGASALVYARKVQGEPLAEALNDARPPLLYLRSFEDDEGLLLSTWNMLNNDRSSEETLFAALRAGGPVFAVGRPGEPLPPIGATRVYVDHDHWQELVSDMMLRSRAVVLRAGVGEGIRWEFDKVVSQVSPNRLLLFAPGDDRRYATFCQTVGACFPQPLPKKRYESQIIFFSSNWEARPLLQKPITEVSADASAGATQPLQAELAALLQADALVANKPSSGLNLSPYLSGGAQRSRIANALAFVLLVGIFVVFVIVGPESKFSRLLRRLKALEENQSQPIQSPKYDPRVMPLPGEMSKETKKMFDKLIDEQRERRKLAEQDESKSKDAPRQRRGFPESKPADQEQKLIGPLPSSQEYPPRE